MKLASIYVTLVLLAGYVQIVDAQEIIPTQFNTIIEMTGRATIHRVEWTDPNAYEEVNIGDHVGDTDIISADIGVIVTIECKNGVVSTISETASSPSECITLERFNPEETVRSGDSQKILLIYPIGKIIDTRPSMEWENIQDAASYNIKITQGETILIRAENITNERFLYPSNKPNLKAGEYTIIIEPVNRFEVVIKEKVTEIVIVIISDSEYQQIEAEFDKRNSNLNFSNKDLLIYRRAIFLSSKGLIWEAIKLLEKEMKVHALTNDFSNVNLGDRNAINGMPMAYLVLGSLYVQLGLTNAAIEPFKKAQYLSGLYNMRSNEVLAIYALNKLGAYKASVSDYCMLKRAADFYDSVGEIGNNPETIKAQMEDWRIKLGGEPECS